ncbi:MAG: hypothetical protein AAF297_11850 [Planctomycetota bacterium]
MSCVKGIVRWGLTAALIGGGTAVVAETVRPGSVGAIMGQAGNAVASVIDSNIDDPVALRAQLKALEAEYPGQISEVRRDLSEAQEQLSQLEREQAISERVVALANEDLSRLEQGIAQARGVQEEHGAAIVRISFDNRKLGLKDAYGQAGQIEQTISVYETRASEIATESEYLAKQRDQLAELLTSLETEHAEFQAQLFQLDAQIDSIARSDRMLAMMEDRQETIDAHQRYQAKSLDQLEGRLASVRSEQQSRLAQLAGQEAHRDYEDEARFLIERDGGVVEIDPTGWQPSGVIEIDADAEPESLVHRD